MKVAASLLLASTVLVSSVAFAQSAPDAPKTRAEVRAELVAAQRAGQIPTSDTDYPPSADTVRHNQELYRLSEHFSEKHPRFASTGSQGAAE